MSYYVLEKALGDHDHGRALLYSSDGNFLVASYSKAFTDEYGNNLYFDKEGNITDWVECFGEKHEEETTINEAIHSTMMRFNRLGENEQQ